MTDNLEIDRTWVKKAIENEEYAVYHLEKMSEKQRIIDQLNKEVDILNSQMEDWILMYKTKDEELKVMEKILCAYELKYGELTDEEKDIII